MSLFLFLSVISGVCTLSLSFTSHLHPSYHGIQRNPFLKTTGMKSIVMMRFYEKVIAIYGPVPNDFTFSEWENRYLTVFERLILVLELPQCYKGRNVHPEIHTSSRFCWSEDATPISLLCLKSDTIPILFGTTSSLSNQIINLALLAIDSD